MTTEQMLTPFAPLNVVKHSGNLRQDNSKYSSEGFLLLFVMFYFVFAPNDCNSVSRNQKKKISFYHIRLISDISLAI